MIVAANHETDLLAQLAMSGAAAFHDELRRDLLRRLTAARRRGADDAALIEVARNVMGRYTVPLARLLADSRLAAFLIGGGRAATRVHLTPPKGGAEDTPTPGLPPVRRLLDVPGDTWEWDGGAEWWPIIEEAARDLQERQLLSQPEYAAVAAEVRAKAFTVAAAQTEEAIGSVRDALVEAVRDGTGVKAFRESVAEDFDTSALGPGELESIFRTGVATAISKGLDRVLAEPMIDEEFPFEAWFGIDDSRQTELCNVANASGLDGTNIYYRGDPECQRLRPTRHYNCRCGRTPYTVEMAAVRGVKYAKEWLRLGYRPPYVNMPRVPVELPTGWTPGGVAA